MTNGKPTVLLISTPAYCQTNVCGPVLELLIEAAPDKRGVNVIHAEVYADVADHDGDILQATLTEAIRAYRLSFEPSLVAVGRDGVVGDRLDFVFDRQELDETLATIIGR